MSTSMDQFDADDLKVIAELAREDGVDLGLNSEAGAGDPQASANQGATPGAADGGTSAQASSSGDNAGASNTNDDSTQQGQQGNAASGTQADEQQAGGNLKGALRASRRAEHRAKAERDAALAELERLKQLNPAGAADPNAPDLEALEQDFPAIARVVKSQAQQIEQLSRQVGANTQGDNTQGGDFTPEQLPAAVQQIVDEIPGLLDLQHDPDQTGWTLAKGYDAVLRTHPTWGTKPETERFAEAARRAKAELSQAPASAPAPSPAPSAQQTAQQRAAAAAAKAATRTPESLSDFGGAATEPDGTNLARFTRMSESDIEAELLRGG
jgi:hypothetical protein